MTPFRTNERFWALLLETERKNRGPDPQALHLNVPSRKSSLSPESPRPTVERKRKKKKNEKERLIYDESPGEKRKKDPPPFVSEGGPHIKTFPLSRKKANVSPGLASTLNLFRLWCVCEVSHQPFVRPSDALLFLRHANKI